MFLAGRLQMIDNMPYDEGIKYYLDLGFEGVEINNVDKKFKFRDEFLDENVIISIKDALSDKRIKGFSIGSHMNYIDSDDCFEKIILSMDVANKLGTDIVIINGAIAKGNANEWDQMISRTKELAQEAKKRNIRLAKEFEPKFIASSCADMLKVFDMVGSDNLFANLDLGHVFLEDEKPLDAIRAMGDKIIHCHIENMKMGIHNHLPFYEGDMDIPSYVNMLKEIGYRGQLSFDYYNDNYLKVAPKCIEYMKELI